jgi:Domain of unknown function (DUF4412)
MPSLDCRTLTLAALALLAPAAASADTKAIYESAKGNETLTFSVKGPMVRWEAVEFKKDKRYALYDGTRGTMILVDEARQQITEMDPETMRKQRAEMQARMAPMVEQLKKQMQNMPPEQRRKMEQRMDALMHPESAASPSMTFTTKAIGSGRVHGIPCKRLSILRGGKAVHELCMATRTDAGMSRADYDTMIKMFDTMRNMASAVTSASLSIPADLKGMPVEMKNYTDGTVRTLKSISTATLPADAFKVPPYKKVTFGDLAAPRH